MNNKILKTLIPVIIGVLMIALSYIYYKKFSFVISGLGLALIGISIELYLKNRKDTFTLTGQSRNIINAQDERTLLVIAKSGEIMNYIMDFFTIMALIIAQLLNVSFTAMIILFSLVLIRLVISPLVKNYYEKTI